MLIPKDLISLIFFELSFIFENLIFALSSKIFRAFFKSATAPNSVG